MKKFLIFLLLISFCGGSSETLILEDATTNSSSTPTSTTTSTSTSTSVTTVKIAQAPTMKLELCDDEIDPTQTDTWAYEIQVINFNSKIKAIEYILYFNDEEIAKDRESFIVNENSNDYYGLQSTAALTDNGYTLKVITTVFTVDDLETEIICETYVLGAKDLNSFSSTTTIADTTSTTTTITVIAFDYPQLTISEISSSIPEYNRDEWNHWIDENGDCQNTRHEVLIEESQDTVTYTSDTLCSVNTGKWFGFYTGQYYYNASDLDIDHFIPLKNAHQSGGYNWSSAKKEEFANYRLDPDNLIAVNLSANRSKGAKGPDEWKPSNTDYWCEYAYDWIRIKDYWNLTATQAEWDALISMIETCPEGFIYADAQQEPIVELPTPTTTTSSTTTTSTSTTTTVPSSQPDNPGNSKNCSDFSNYSEAKTWFDTYYPYYGDIGDLDRDGDLIPCESLPGAP